MNGNNNGNMNTFELPPIRKIGPAVLPKPKNIKIQAGRVIRLNYSNNFTQQTWNNQLNQQDENEDEFIDHFSSISDNTAHRPIQEEVTNNDVDDDDDLPLPPPPSQQLLNEINNRLAKFENMPSRAKLVKIPVDGEVDYETEAASDMRYDKENDMSTSSTILSNDNSQSSSDLMNNGLILSTSRYKFPRKNSGFNSAQNQQKQQQQSQMIPQTPPPPPTPPLPPPPPLPPVYPSSISPAKTCTINGMKPTTINFSADAGANGRPTITITTSRGPNSPTITATTSPTSSQSNIFSYNIPVQHMYQQQQQQLGNSTNSTNEMGPPGSPTVSNNTITLPLTANGGGNFIISASSLSGLPQEFLLNGNMITKPTLISNGSYIIPVSMKLMSGGGNSNGAPNSPPPTLVGASSSSSSSLSSPPTINTTSINSPTHHRNNSSPSSSSSPHSPLSGHNSPSSSSTSTQHQFTASAGNNNGNISPTSPSSPLGNILIKTTNGGPGVSGRTRIEDEVDLLKDLLIKNLNSAVIKETQSQNQNKFYGVCNRCNEKIIGAENGLRAMENLFHVTCFVCYGCGTQLQGHHFYAMENRSFCENCYMRLLERCSYCSKPITDRILRATGKPFHPECFCCVACKKNLDGIPFTVDASNKIHCIECFHEKYAPRCFICHLPITPDPGQEETVRIVAMDRSFHVNCYKCEECGVSLSSNSENAGGCFPLDDHIYCKSCNLKLIRSLAMNGGMTHPSSPLSKFTPASSQAPRSTDL